MVTFDDIHKRYGGTKGYAAGTCDDCKKKCEQLALSQVRFYLYAGKSDAKYSKQRAIGSYSVGRFCAPCVEKRLSERTGAAYME